MYRRWVERIGALLIGLVVLLTLVESGLRIAGWLALQRRDAPRAADLTVLCVGDSYTYGLGAPMGQGYPGQLEELLAQAAGGRSVAVINRGIPSATSARVLRELQQSLPGGGFDAVVVLAGGTTTILPSLPLPTHPSKAQAVAGLRLARLLPMLGRDLQGERLRRMLPRDRLGPGLAGIVERFSVGAGPDSPPEPSCGQRAQRHCARAAGLLELGWVGSAEAVYRQAVQVEPSCGCGHRGRLLAAVSANDPVAVDAASLGWLAASPGDPMLHDVRMSYLIETGRIADASAWLDDNGARFPDHLQPAWLRADLHLRLGDLDRAEAAYTALLDDPGMQCQGLLGLVRVSLTQGDRVGAGQWMERLLEQPGPSCARPAQLVSLSCSLGMHDHAMEQFRIKLVEDPASWMGALFALAPCVQESDLTELRWLLTNSGVSMADVEEVMGGVSADGRLRAGGHAAVRADLARMQALAAQAGVPMILTTYPYPSRVNTMIRELAQAQGIGLADSALAFEGLWARGEPRARYFVGDGDDPVLGNDHCSEAGYGVMAEVLLGALEAAGVLDAQDQ